MTGYPVLLWKRCSRMLVASPCLLATGCADAERVPFELEAVERMTVERPSFCARWFAANLPASYSPMYGVLLDMVGDRNPRFPVEGYSAELAPHVARRVWGVAAALGYGSVFPAEVGPRIVDDHLPLNEAGIPTINIIDFEYGPGNRFWHTPRDLPENTSAVMLGIVGEVLAELVYRGG